MLFVGASRACRRCKSGLNGPLPQGAKVPLSDATTTKIPSRDDDDEFISSLSRAPPKKTRLLCNFSSPRDDILLYPPSLFAVSSSCVLRHPLAATLRQSNSSQVLFRATSAEATAADDVHVAGAVFVVVDDTYDDD